jgi:hypothetical protein
MSRTFCPFKQVCPFAEECQDHRWLCFWPIWLVMLGAVGFVVYIFSTGGLM